MIDIKNVWTSFKHSGFDSENFSIKATTSNQELVIHIESQDEGIMVVSLSLKQAIALNKDIKEALKVAFEEVYELAAEIQEEL